MGRKKKVKTTETENVHLEEEYKKAPHTFVFHRNQVGHNILQLIQDFRRMLEPYTASNLQVKKRNVLKDFVSVAGTLNVSNFLMFSSSQSAVNLRIARIPRGPTLSFKLLEYTFSKDVVSNIKRYHMEQKQFKHAPLLILNGFSSEEVQIKLMSSMFQNMFPSINVNQVKLVHIRRCVLITYDSESSTIKIRHYNIKVSPVGISKPVKKLLKAQIPDLSRFEDIADYVMRGGDMSESEADEDPSQANVVTLLQNASGRGNQTQNQSAIRLTEIGPRLTLKLYKVEEGLCSGDILYHSFVTKPSKKITADRRKRVDKQTLKERRKRLQEQNVEKKRKIKESLKAASRKKPMREKNVDDGEDDDDDAYFREATGDNPDRDLFLKKTKINQVKNGKINKKSNGRYLKSKK